MVSKMTVARIPPAMTTVPADIRNALHQPPAAGGEEEEEDGGGEVRVREETEAEIGLGKGTDGRRGGRSETVKGEKSDEENYDQTNLMNKIIKN